MEITMIILFLLGYVCIAMEHTIKVNKAASALLLCAILWTLYIFSAGAILPDETAFQIFASEEVNAGVYPGSQGWDAFVASIPSLEQFREMVVSYVTEKQVIEHVGDVASILFFLMGAMTIVELIDVHGGFSIITDRIKTNNKKKLLWMLCTITFFMSAILDNLTTTIVMVMLLRKLVRNQKERWLFGSMVVISANSGGAFSPIGDVTTIMLWVKGNVTTAGLLPNLILPSIVSTLVPLLIVTYMLKSEDDEEATEKESTLENKEEKETPANIITKAEQKCILGLGIGALIFVPIFKSITHLPPFVGVLLGLGVLWVYTELIYHRKKQIPESSKARISNILGRIDLTTILFFLGILMAVNALQCAGILHDLSIVLDEKIGNIYAINIIIGFLSSIVDNVPLVAGAMGMYDMATFASDSVFWLFLAYCAGVGGSMLIIGSAAGVVVMGLEKVTFVWYLKKISWIAMVGYLAGAGLFILQETVIRPILGI